MTRRGIASIALLSVLLAACGGADDDESEGTPAGPGPGSGPGADSLVDLVRSLPDIPDADSLTITFGDVEGIAEANGVDAPDDGDLDALLDWALSPGADGVPIILPGALQTQYLATHDEFDAELGVSLWGTERYAGVESAPRRVAVLEGDHDADDLTEAIGEPDDGVWSVGGEEFTVDLDDRSAARPLGEGLRLAVADQGVVIASTEGLARGVEAEGSLVDDALDEVLTALDDPDLVSGLVVCAPLGAQQLTANGVAFGVDGDDVVARLALSYPDDEDAEPAVAEVEEYFTEGSSQGGLPWSELLTVDDVTSEGSVVVVELSFGGEQSPNVVVQLLMGYGGDLPQARS